MRAAVAESTFFVTKLTVSLLKTTERLRRDPLSLWLNTGQVVYVWRGKLSLR